MPEIIYERTSPDGLCSAWITVNPNQPGRYTVFMISPWNNSSGTHFYGRDAAYMRVDHWIDDWYPKAQKQ